MHCKNNLPFKSNVALPPIDFYLKENELILTLPSFCECFMVHLLLQFSLCAKCNQLCYNCWRLEQKEHVFKRPFKTEKSEIKITVLSQTIWQKRPLQGGNGGATLFLLANFQNSLPFSTIYIQIYLSCCKIQFPPHFSAIQNQIYISCCKFSAYFPLISAIYSFKENTRQS